MVPKPAPRAAINFYTTTFMSKKSGEKKYFEKQYSNEELDRILLRLVNY